MNYHRTHCEKWASIVGALMLSSGALASSPSPSLDSGALAISAFLGGIVGVIGAAFKAKAGRLLLMSFLAVVLFFSVFMVPMYGGSPVAFFVSAFLAAPFMIGLSLVYGIVRLALNRFTGPRP